jgi:NTE family protein
MPFGSEGVEEGTGLALSGGGYRAMLFHVGAVWRLNELGRMRDLTRISSVSGGSLFAGRLAVSWKNLSFDAKGVAANYVHEVADPVMDLATKHIDVPATLSRLNPFSGPARHAAEAYKKHLVGKASLQDLSDHGPRFVFNATHLATGTSWRFSKPYMGSYRVGLVRNPDVPVAIAMAASAAFPPVLSPLRLELDPDEVEKTKGADLHGNRKLRTRAVLSDGGVYDNLGLETVWSRYETVLASDAGGPMSIASGGFRIPGSQVKRALDVATDQARKLRRLGLIADITRPDRGGALWMTSTDIRDYPARSPFAVEPSWPGHLAQIRTRLNPFSETLRKRLVNWGYLTADVAIRSFVDTHASEPTSLPFSEVDFSRPAA